LTNLRFHFENLDLILGAIGKSIFELGGEASPEAFGFGRGSALPGGTN
jgi:hypothetical protein